jgi:heme oxygenase
VVSVKSVSNVLTKLNLATRAWHADVDDPWLELMRPDVSPSAYRAQLVRTYGLVAPFESACMYTRGVSTLLEYRQLLRAGLIAQDLLALGLPPNQVSRIPTCPAITMFRDVGEALGWLYVIERSTLLQEGLKRHLVEKLPHVGNAFHYLGACEGQVGDHWVRFGRMLDRAVAQLDIEDSILNAAEEAFAHTKQWLTASTASRTA